MSIPAANQANRISTGVLIALAAVPTVFILGLYLWPLITLAERGLAQADAWEVLRRPRVRSVIWFTLWQSVASTVLTVLVGLGPAYVISRYQFPGRQLLIGLITATFVLPTVVMGAAVTALGMPRGVGAILLAHVLFNIAVILRVVGPLWQQIPRDLSHAARTLGAPPWRVFWHVTLPLLAPALWASAAVVFALTFTSFGVVRVLGTPARSTIEVEIWRRATQLGDLGGAVVLSVVQLGVMLLIVAGAGRVQRRSGLSLRLDFEGAPERPYGPGQRLIVSVVGAATALAMLMPVGAMVLRSVRDREGFTLSAWRTLGQREIRPGVTLGIDPMASIIASVQTAAAATALALLIGGLAAVAIMAARGRAGWLDLGLMLPLGTSAVTIGLGMVITFSRPPVDWRSTWWLLVLGHSVVAVPFVVRTMLPVLRAIPAGLTEAALTLGASPTRAWWSVVVGQAWRPLGASAGVVAAISLGEFGASSMLSRSGAPTVPLAIDALLGRTGTLLQGQAFALATILTVMTVTVVLIADRLTRPPATTNSSDSSSAGSLSSPSAR